MDGDTSRALDGSDDDIDPPPPPPPSPSSPFPLEAAVVVAAAVFSSWYLRHSSGAVSLPVTVVNTSRACVESSTALRVWASRRDTRPRQATAADVAAAETLLLLLPFCAAPLDDPLA